jgi:hypothetical protein
MRALFGRITSFERGAFAIIGSAMTEAWSAHRAAEQ